MKTTSEQCLTTRCAFGLPMPFRSRSGMALMLVIGMLALMVVMGIAFSVYMRTERVAAGSFKNNIVARQLLPVALNRVLQRINDEVGASACPTWNYLESSGGAPVIGVTNPSAMAWIPRAALGAGAVPSPKWINDSSISEGRVAYLIVNCSGLLDANYSGADGIPRGNGTNVNEIQLAACLDPAEVTTLVSNRTYETAQELMRAVPTASNFVSFSKFPLSYPSGTNISLVDLSGDEVSLSSPSRSEAIINAFRACGFTDSGQAEFIFTNLLDYVDSDNTPKDLGSACTESVPMFNEILVTNVFRFFSTTNFDMRGSKIFVEWFYPFVTNSSVSEYAIEYKVDFERAGLTPATFPLPPSLAGTIAPLDVAYYAGLKFAVSTPSITIALSPSSQSYASFIGSNVQYKVKIGLKMHAVDASGPVVDAVPWPTNTTLDFTMPSILVPNPASAANIGVKMDAECTDPRFNWSAGQWRMRASIDTLGAMNSISTTYLTGIGYKTDGHADMFVANRPMINVGELTYLLRGQSIAPEDYRWNTIRLFDSVSGGIDLPVDRVFDYFTIGSNTHMKGFVNPNSGIQSVLTAVFEGMPLNKYPGDPAPVATLSRDQAVSLSSFWMNTSSIPLRGNFLKLSDIGHATNVFNSSVFSALTLTSFQKEAFFRNTAGLFNTRQQYYIIVLYAQAAKFVPLIDDRVGFGDVRAIAEIWRDPLPNAEGIHPCLIRMVHVLSDE